MKQFQQIYNQTMEQTCQSLEEFPWEDMSCYTGWLAQSYYFVRHSTRLLALAAGSAPLESDHFHQRFIAHLREELGHEKLLLQDLSSLEQKIQDWPELLETTLFYEQQYFLVQKHGPGALMGWIIFLEGMASEFGPRVVERTRNLSKASTRFLRLHSEEDVDHIQSAFSIIAQCELDQNPVFLYNFKSSQHFYLGMLRKISEQQQLIKQVC